MAGQLLTVTINDTGMVAMKPGETIPAGTVVALLNVGQNTVYEANLVGGYWTADNLPAGDYRLVASDDLGALSTSGSRLRVGGDGPGWYEIETERAPNYDPETEKLALYAVEAEEDTYYDVEELSPKRFRSQSQLPAGRYELVIIPLDWPTQG